ncbi:MAG: iron ABC transporter permease [Christensenellaceae bacterium]|jgi:iron complex transport system permease protein|nr:iron ABC transporter permease [Christensenellaceae bacterium]
MKRRGWLFPALFLLLVLAGGVSLLFGGARLPLARLLAAFRGRDEAAAIILWSLRLPRVLLSMTVGAALAIAGALMQGVFQNPMADPHILGVSSGAALGAALGMALFGGVAALPPLAFVFGLLAAGLVYALSRGGSTVALLLAGTAVSACLSAMVSMLMLFHRDGLERVLLWTMGSFTMAGFDRLLICLPATMVGLLGAMFLSGDLNALQLGDEQAASLGVRVGRTRLFALLIASFMTAAAVSMSGIIGFVGLMVPHGVRLIAGPAHERLIPLSALGGAALLCLTDTLARSLLAPMEIPVGVLTALLGGPFFLLLLRKNLKGGHGLGL